MRKLRMCVLLLLVGGGGNGCDCGQAMGGHVVLNGSVEKGPFVLGTAVTVSPVSAQGNPTGQVFNTQTTNDLGEFAVAFDYVGIVALQGNGFYYNEVSGDLSTAPLTLRALHEVAASGTQSAFLNVLTHLSYDRTVSLMQSGSSFTDAILTSEGELRAALQIGPVGFDPAARGSEMNILGGEEARNAYLFAVSAVLAQAAALEAGEGPVDATLQELLNRIALELRDDGTLSGDVTALVAEAERTLNTERIASSLAERLSELGSEAAVPDLGTMIDADGDGLVNNDDGDDDGDGVEDQDDHLVAVVAGQEQTYAIGADGFVVAWGRNSSGALGDGTTEDQHGPVRLESLPQAVSLSGGISAAAMVARDGTVWYWGWSGKGAAHRLITQHV